MRMLGSMIVLTACSFAVGEDKPAAPSGTWVREASGFDLKIEFAGKDVLKMTAMADENGAIVTSKYTVKDGLVKAKDHESRSEGRVQAAPKEGIEFSFKGR